MVFMGCRTAPGVGASWKNGIRRECLVVVKPWEKGILKREKGKGTHGIGGGGRGALTILEAQSRGCSGIRFLLVLVPLGLDCSRVHPHLKTSPQSTGSASISVFLNNLALAAKATGVVSLFPDAKRVSSLDRKGKLTSFGRIPCIHYRRWFRSVDRPGCRHRHDISCLKTVS